MFPEPLKHKHPHAVGRLGAGGLLVRALPELGRNAPAAALVELRRIRDLVTDPGLQAELLILTAFPGPLLPR